MPKSILLVDDSPLVRTRTRRVLEEQPGLQVCGEASDGVEAIAKALELSPDLIVMDLSMPRMNGLEAARQVKQTLPHVPIILFTLHKNAVRQADASKSGVSAVISKVDEPDLLVSEIASLLNQSGRAGA